MVFDVGFEESFCQDALGKSIMWRVALSRARSETAGSRGAADAGAVCQAAREDE
jgi:hypothetical protein